MSKEEIGIFYGRGGAERVNDLESKSSIIVGYDPLFGSPEYDDLILLELDERLLPDLLHQRVTLRGQPDEDAVLCTPSKTYALKFVSTSNSAFLIPPSHYSPTPLPNVHLELNPQQVFSPVIKLASGTVELTHVAPRLDKLKSLLSERPFSVQEVMNSEDFEDSAENLNQRKLYTWYDLIESVQASDDELRAGLQAVSALEIDGWWRIVDEKLMDDMLRMLLHNSVLNDWSLDTLNEDDVVDALASDGFSHKLALHCLRIFGRKVDGGEAVCASWRLDDRLVCIHFARETLRAGKMKMENFMQEWLRKVPDGMQANFDMLEGEVLTEKIGVETWVRAFSISSLPTTPADRFSVLFREQSKWEWKDLQPYIRDLRVPGLSSEGLLLKYTRRTQPTPDAEPVFSAR